MYNKINVCYASSNEYAPYTGVSLFSCLENNAAIVDKVFLLSFGIQNDNIQKFREIVSSYHRELILIDAVPVLKPIFARIHLDAFRGSYATFSRAFISYLLPEEIDNVLYIDSDTIVDGSVEDIRNLRMFTPDKVFAAVIGTNQYFPNNSELVLENGNKTYYQAGVMFFDLNNWRKYQCSERIEDYVLKHSSSYTNADQTVINNVIEEQLIVPLHPKFNYWGHIFRGARFWYQMSLGGFWSKDIILEAMEHPVIIHYKGNVVHPWRRGSISPLADRYHYYKEMSPWKNEKEYSINYDCILGRETDKLKIENNQVIRFLRYHPIIIKIMYFLVKIKHMLIK